MSTYTIASRYDNTSIKVRANNAIAALNLWVAVSSNLRQEYDDQLFEDLCSFVSVDGMPVQLVYLSKGDTLVSPQYESEI